MAQATDVTIDGAGYMVAPGTYKRMQDGAPEGRTGRIVVRDFFGGQRRSIQLERDRSWDSVGVGPCYGGQGVEPWPFATIDTDLGLNGAAAVPGAGQRCPSLVVEDRAYLAVGTKLFRSVALAASAWADFGLVYTAPATITDLSYYRGDLAVLMGNASDIRIYGTGFGAVAAGTTAVLQVGEKGRLGVGYANRLVYADPAPGQTDQLRMTTGGGIDTRQLDAPIVRMGLWQGKIAIATRASLWTLGGKSDPATAKWVTDPAPFFTHGVWSADDDFAFLLGFGGRLYTWLANQVMLYHPEGDRAGWRAAGPTGQTCHGATVAAGSLIVCLTTRLGDTETWACDGSGWWLIHRAALGTGATRIWPLHTGGAGNVDLVTLRDGSAASTVDLYRLLWRSPAEQTYPTSGAFRTSLLDAGERDKTKAWRKLGAVFAVPGARGNQASADAVTLTLAYSLDGGATFATAATVAAADPTQRTLELDAALANNAAASRTLQLRLTWTSVADWAPVLIGLWAEYELLDAPARRRRWQFKVHARDAVVQRDGAPAPRPGRQLAADLWAAWRAGATVPFRDLDFDATAETVQTRIVGIAEDVPKPADGARWGESVVALTLVEV